MRLFRAALSRRRRADHGDEIAPVKIAQKLGYITVGLHVDTEDWQRPASAR